MPAPWGVVLAAALSGSRPAPCRGGSVYGAIIILAVILALDTAGTTTGDVVGGIVLATMAVAFAELYSELLGEAIRERRPLTRREVVAMSAELSAILLAPLPPLVLVGLSGLGVMSLRTAVSLSAWLLIALLFVLGFVAARVSGRSVVRSALGAALLLAVGLVMVGVKSFAAH